MEDNKSVYNFESFDLIEFIIKHLKPIIIITAIAAIVSIVVSLVIVPRYKSTVIIFPTSQGSVSQNLLGVVMYKTILKLGEDEEVEQLMQVLKSDDIRNKIIKKYDLMKHYGIDPDSKYPLTEIDREFDKNISFIQTEYMSVKIEVLDVDPQLAADIANNIAALVDTAFNNMKQERAQKALKIVEKEYLGLKNQIATLEDSLTLLRSYGINDYVSQSEVYNNAYAEAILTHDKQAKKDIEGKLKILSKYGGAYLSIVAFLEYEKEHLSDIKAKYAEASVDASQDLPHTFIVNHAKVPEKKTYPIRWLIVSVSTLSAFIFALFLLLIFEYGKAKYFIKE
ncbi:MAG: hypothetical protein GXO79_04775 [Chlorobi bacterium]|nr:hypothetical protein [Chlorobiota bacterium]